MDEEEAAPATPVEAAAATPVETPAEAEPRIIARPDHAISRKLISSGAVKVLYRLKKSGYKAYLCGGAVRDLMLGGRPKDFDVCTDAEPKDLRRLFRNARIIGRRFRLAHVIFHDGIVEVSTFRRTPDPEEQKGKPGDFLITSDNAFGTPREDAFRRDFTVNALFYNVADFSVIDYVGGTDDLERGLIRVIGEPDLRFREDPVRMLRACEFAGRLGFSIESRTQEAIQNNAGDLRRAAAPRLTEELMQLLKCGHAGAAMQWMLELGLLDVLLPEVGAMVAAAERGVGNFSGILPTLDRMTAEGREVPDAVLLAAVLLPEVMMRRFEVERKTGEWMKIQAFLKVVRETLESFLERFSLANFKRAMVTHVLEGFHRLCRQGWTPAQRVRFA
ncbi:MAG: polynucleotide adenylyltransferase PcnB, partial [Acidobacteriota bacterium]